MPKFVITNSMKQVDEPSHAEKFEMLKDFMSQHNMFCEYFLMEDYMRDFFENLIEVPQDDDSDDEEGDKKWFVTGEEYVDFDEDGEPAGSITDYLYSGDEKSARKYFDDCINENHKLVKDGKGEEMEYHRLEIGWETKNEDEYVDYAKWGFKHNNYSFDASF